MYYPEAALGYRRASRSRSVALRAWRHGPPVAALGVLCLGSPAWAQTSGAAVQVGAGTGVVPTGVEEVVVTARHRTEKAQTVPIALTAIGATKLDNTGTNSINKLQVLVPALQVIETNPRNTSFNIRGIGANVSITNDGLEGGVGVYVDGVLYARPGQAAFAFPDISDVQVLRGPQGTLFGKNTTAGAIDVHSRLPSFTPQADLEASLGNYGFWQVKGTVSDGFNDKVAARVSFLADQRSGTFSSLYSNQHYNTLDDKAGRVQVLALPTDNLTVRLIADYSHQLENCCVSIPLGVFTTLENGSLLPNNFYQREAYLGNQLPPFNQRNNDIPDSRLNEFHMETGGVSLQADYDLNGYTLTSLSSWRMWNWWPFNGAQLAPGLEITDNGSIKEWERQASQEFRVTSPTGGAIDYTAGAFFFYQDVPGYTRTGYGPAAGPYIFGAKVPKSLADLALNGFNVQSNSDPVTNSYAIYGQATYHVLPGLDLTGGLRYTYEDKSGSYNQTTFGGGSLAGLSPALVGTVDALRKSIAGGVGSPFYYKDLTHNSSLSYLMTLSYKVTDDVYTYATYSRGNKSGGINVTLLPPNLTNDAIVKPERVDNYELGVKSSWFDNRLVLNADVFWIEDSDYQGVAVAPLASGLYTYFLSSVPKVQSRGFELDSRAHPTDWLSLNFAGAYTDAIYESYPAAQCPPEVSGAATKVCNLTGAPVPGTSRWTMSAGGEVTRPIGSVGRYDIVGYTGADFSLRSAFYVTANDSKYSLVPGYGLLDLRLGARTADGKYDLFLWSHNATNTHYFYSIGAASPVSGLITGILGDPLTFGVTLKVRL
jgi:iron complex outermembrane recepter protein